MHTDHRRLFGTICILCWIAWIALAALAAATLLFAGDGPWLQKDEILGQLIAGTLLCLGFPLALRILLWALARGHKHL
ncbi:MAG: hypothetical protein GKR89_25030 [Candidatus Latescibacteria bacterium]|nr:hypothetical protein [Candidatus Latescibacterota bacterium]